jgi:hypothetical protein
MANPSEYPLPPYHPAISEYLSQSPIEKDQIISSVPYWYDILHK